MPMGIVNLDNLFAFSQSRTISKLLICGLGVGRASLKIDEICLNLTIPGTGLYVGEQASSLATMLHEKLPEAGVDTPSPEIAVMRIVSASGPDFRCGVEMFCLHADVLHL